jgi:DNA-binding MarR family transcriptional regulator
VIVELTDRGRDLVDAAVGAHAAIDRRLLSQLEPDEIGTLAALLRKVLAAVELPGES